MEEGYSFFEDLERLLRVRDIAGIKTLVPVQRHMLLDFVCIHGHDDDAASLIRYMYEMDPKATNALYNCAARNKHKMIRELLDVGENVNKPRLANRQTALWHALKWKSNECARVLVDAGARIPSNDEAQFIWECVDVPQWVWDFKKTRNATHAGCIIVLGLNRCCRRRDTNKDVLRIIARCVWATRGH